MIWMAKIRLRLLAFLLGLALTVIALISLTTLPAWPVLGVAVAAAAVAVNSMASRLRASACHGCGHALADCRAGEYGVECPRCGALTHTFAGAPPELRAHPHHDVDEHAGA